MDSVVIVKMNKNDVYMCPKNINSVKCLNGIFWVTWESGEDAFLRKNEQIFVKNKKKVLVQALKGGSIHFFKKIISPGPSINLLSFNHKT